VSLLLALTGIFCEMGHTPVTIEAAQSQSFNAGANAVPVEPFLASNGLTPLPTQYQGPMFSLSHEWPAEPMPQIKDAPWLNAIGGGPITTANAAAYVAAMKDYVSANARLWLLDYAHWDAAKAQWYNEPWLGSERESIHGTYAAGQFGPDIFPHTGLKTTFDTFVIAYYDRRAAATLSKVWGPTAMTPDVQTANFQFPEGSVIVKAAVFISDDPAQQNNWWPVTDGAAAWPIYVGVPEQKPGPPAVLTAYVMQFDIVVKDTVASPKTGWVFATLVYDAKAKGDAWDRMVPLGAQWGNDPGVDPTKDKKAKLEETWINPAAPKYATETLGWGGRLSGPNDGGRNDIQVGKKELSNHPNSSCMSCHGPAEWQPEQHKQVSFLLPSYPNPQAGAPPYQVCPAGDPRGTDICSPAPDSADWAKWFQDRPGSEPQDQGSVATDYDMVFAFKTLPAWWKATGPKDAPMPFALRSLNHGAQPAARYNQYSGAPLKPPPAVVHKVSSW
jgi:hypothetical protein